MQTMNMRKTNDPTFVRQALLREPVADKDSAVSSLSCNPIEKKPLYHFYPGTVALTVGSWSCI